MRKKKKKVVLCCAMLSTLSISRSFSHFLNLLGQLGLIAPSIFGLTEVDTDQNDAMGQTVDRFKTSTNVYF